MMSLVFFSFSHTYNDVVIDKNDLVKLRDLWSD